MCGDNVMEITNKRGEVFKIGDIIYFNIVEKGALNIITRKTKIKSFITTEKDTYIVTSMKDTLLTYINVNDLYHTEEEAKEVITRWQRDVLQKELEKEIISSLMKQ